jgi:hypothetical protein
MSDNDLSTLPTEQLFASLGAPATPATGASAPTAQAGPDLSGASTDDLLKALPPANAGAPQAPDPTEGMSTFQRFLAGAGKAVADTGRGVGQFLGLVPQSDVDEAARLDRPLMNTGAGVAGDIAGQVGQMAVGGIAAGALPGPATVAARLGPITRAAMQAGAFSAAQPVQTGDSRLGNTAEGAVLGGAGQAIAGGATRLAAGASDLISPQVKALYLKAVDAGIPVNVAQLSDSGFVKALASQLERLPFTGATDARQVQQQAFNRAVSRTMGEDAPAITPDVYTTAKQRIGQQFEDLSARNSMAVDMPLLQRLAGVVDEANRYAASDTANAVRNVVDDVMAKMDPNGAIPGRAYQSTDSQLGRLMKNGGEKAFYLGQLRDAMRGAMDQSITPADQEAWQTARSQWRALKTVRDLAAKDPAGNIAPGQLAGRVGASNAGKEALASGTAGELGDLAAIGKQFVRDPVPDSGTAQRLLAQTLLTGGIGGGAYAAGHDPVTAAAAAGASLVGGRALTRVLNSPAAARYMVSGAGPVAEAAASAARALPTVLPAAGNAETERGARAPAAQRLANGGQVFRTYPEAARARFLSGGEFHIAPAQGGFALVPKFADGGPVQAGPTPSPGAAEIDARAHEAATSPLNPGPQPSDAQQQAGNYRVGRLRLHGLNISIESPEGSTRRGVDPDGTPWQSTITGAHYGRVRGTVASDGDALDVFVGRTPSKEVHVIDQLTPDGQRFDEPKALMNVGDANAAKAIYDANYPPDWKGFGAISSMPAAAFRAWARSGKLKQPLAWAPQAQEVTS